MYIASALPIHTKGGRARRRLSPLFRYNKVENFDSIILITRINFTIHTVGINSFSMYRYSTQARRWFPKTNADKISKPFVYFHKPHQENITKPSKSAKIRMMLIIMQQILDVLGNSFTSSFDSDRLLTEYQHLPPRLSAQLHHFPN